MNGRKNTRLESAKSNNKEKAYKERFFFKTLVKTLWAAEKRSNPSNK